MDKVIKDILEEVGQNTKKGSKSFYKPLGSDDSKQIRDEYRSRIKISLDGDQKTEFFNESGTCIARGYTRIVIGDYGAYIEFDRAQMCMNNIKNKWPGKPHRPVKYIWMQTIDKSKTKVYDQRGTVKYADYKIGMFYVDPEDLIVCGNTIMKEIK